MGYAIVFSPCICCRRMFGYNPLSVPSSTAFTGQREPICRECFEQINFKRRGMGLEPFPLLPDAYEACDERDLA